MKMTFSCYGTFSDREECRICEVQSYCIDFQKNDRKGALGEQILFLLVIYEMLNVKLL